MLRHACVDWQGDLNLFYRYFAPEIPIGTAPLFDRIDHGLLPINKTRGVNWNWYLGEEVFDLQCALPIIYPQTATIFEVGPAHHDRDRYNFFNRFFDAIDGSYCTPGQRGNSSEGGRPQCGTFKPTNVISYSWALTEHILSFFWQERQCKEYLKLGLQGTSILVASGDWGAGKLGQWSIDRGYRHKCNHDYEDSARVFMPAFPAACPWVTSVGATEMHLGNTVNDPEVGAAWSFFNTSNDEHEWREVSSSGGFALHFDAPSYQKEALGTFFKEHNPRWPYFTDGRWQNGTGRYNRNGRGIPDISAAGRNVASFLVNGYSSGAGTSASAPIVAALINRIVEDRLRAGKGPLGFINPTLYKHPEMLNDVTEGKNGYCRRDDGFEAVEGWDPMTGLGTPNYGLMHDVFMNLP